MTISHMKTKLCFLIHSFIYYAKLMNSYLNLSRKHAIFMKTGYTARIHFDFFLYYQLMCLLNIYTKHCIHLFHWIKTVYWPCKYTMTLNEQDTFKASINITRVILKLMNNNFVQIKIHQYIKSKCIVLIYKLYTMRWGIMIILASITWAQSVDTK